MGPERVLQYNRANRDVAVLCNHQRAVSKTFDVQMGKMDDKISAKMELIKEKKKEVEEKKEAVADLEKEKSKLLTPVKKKSKKKKSKIADSDSDDDSELSKCDQALEKARKVFDQKTKQLSRLNDQLHKLEIAKTDKDA